MARTGRICALVGAVPHSKQGGRGASGYTAAICVCFSGAFSCVLPATWFLPLACWPLPAPTRKTTSTAPLTRTPSCPTRPIKSATCQMRATSTPWGQRAMAAARRNQSARAVGATPTTHRRPSRMHQRASRKRVCGAGANRLCWPRPRCRARPVTAQCAVRAATVAKAPHAKGFTLRTPIFIVVSFSQGVPHAFDSPRPSRLRLPAGRWLLHHQTLRHQKLQQLLLLGSCPGLLGANGH